MSVMLFLLKDEYKNEVSCFFCCFITYMPFIFSGFDILMFFFDTDKIFFFCFHSTIKLFFLNFYVWLYCLGISTRFKTTVHINKFEYDKNLVTFRHNFHIYFCSHSSANQMVVNYLITV